MKLKIPQIKGPLLQRFYRDMSGAAALEMTLVIIPFMLMFLFIAELCSMLYISVSIDLAMAEAMRFTTASSTPSMTVYRTIFLDKMKEKVNYLPLMIYKDANVQFTVNYCNSLAEIANDTCSLTTPISPVPATPSAPAINGTPVAVYTIHYKYEPLFFPIPDMIMRDSMYRKGIYVMEHTRTRTAPPAPPAPPGGGVTP